MHTYPDEELQRIWDGDEDALRRALGKTTRYLLGHHSLAYDEAEDLASEALYRALERKDEFLGQASVHTWLIGFAKKVVLEHIRKRSREAPSELEALDDTTESGESDDEIIKRMYVQAAVSELSERELLFHRLRFRDGLGIKEVAAAMGDSADAIQSLQYRVVAKLRKTLGTLT